MKIGQVSRETGASADALRLYERLGLIVAARRDNGYRDFGPETVALVRLIRQAQEMGFTLAEIGAVLRGLQGNVPGDEVAVLLRGRLAVLDRKIAAMQALRGLVQDRLETVCPLVVPPPVQGGRRRR